MQRNDRLTKFIVGDAFQKYFFVKDVEDGVKLDISDVTGVIYETRDLSKIIHVFSGEDAPIQVDAQTVQFNFTSAITQKCRPDHQISMDVNVGNLSRTFTGVLGTPITVPIKNLPE